MIVSRSHQKVDECCPLPVCWPRFFDDSDLCCTSEKKAGKLRFKKSNFSFLRPVYTSDFRAHFGIELVYFREQKVIVCLVKHAGLM